MLGTPASARTALNSLVFFRATPKAKFWRDCSSMGQMHLLSRMREALQGISGSAV